MDTIELLERSRDLIESTGHCKGFYAKDNEGKSIMYWHDSASSFCAVGAIKRIRELIVREEKELHKNDVDFVFDPKPLDTVVNNAFAFLRKAIHHSHIPTWNDAPERTKEDVIAAYNKTIKLIANGF